MKLLISTFFAFLAISLSIVVLNTTTKQQSNLTLDSVEVLTFGEGDCISGGHGAKSCSVQGGIKIDGVGSSVECSVSCYDDFYACCGFGCHCIPNR